jgi:hypothetical protein
MTKGSLPDEPNEWPAAPSHALGIAPTLLLGGRGEPLDLGRKSMPIGRSQIAGPISRLSSR